ncbi:hypothetical protein [Botrimarina mediterranea]|uniref:Cytochrome C assembly protein n=1 Tax=Botrimarina mediterranea TaxID=2528022 RepID=A0A518KF54_9BACT|nr:hypothetical protein [Botrimarina mediterranea]QDV76418.1 hypothetical protein Spa11_46480 [Botrimarina mediterranea]
MDLSRITVLCFAASYAVALGLEALALVRRRGGGQLSATLSGGRRWGTLGVTVAGLFAHFVYLSLQASKAATPLSSPADWCLIAGAVLAAIYLAMSLTHSRWAVGLFLLPIVLALVGLSQTASSEPFAPERASRFWGMTHGWLLVAAAASVSVGFVAGLMYLLQSWRLRRRLPASEGITLPSLEWLEGASSRSLALSVWLTAGGFLSGLVLSRLNRGAEVDYLLWTDPVVITSAALLGWLLAAVVFRWVYPPARTGRKVAYLTVTAFGFMAITLVSLVFWGPTHGMAPPSAGNRGDVGSARDRQEVRFDGEPATLVVGVTLVPTSHRRLTSPAHRSLVNNPHRGTARG